MPISQMLLPEFDHEMATTRRMLERVPDDNPGWKPHEKSFPIAHLAQLIARMPGWVTNALTQTELDLSPPGGGNWAYTFEKTSTLLAEFDRNVVAARDAIARTTDADLDVPWSLKRGGVTLMTQPRYSIVREMSINHIVHHRGQLSVYLRLLGVPVPMIYGPTADERM